MQNSPPITRGTRMCLSVDLLVNKFHYWLEGRKNKMFIVKPSFLYKINESVIKNLVLYVKDKLPHHKNASIYSYSPLEFAVPFKDCVIARIPYSVCGLIHV